MRRPTLILKENVYSSEASSSCGRVLVTDLHGLGPAQAFLPDSLPYDSHPRGSQTGLLSWFPNFRPSFLTGFQFEPFPVIHLKHLSTALTGHGAEGHRELQPGMTWV